MLQVLGLRDHRQCTSDWFYAAQATVSKDFLNTKLALHKSRSSLFDKEITRKKNERLNLSVLQW